MYAEHRTLDSLKVSTLQKLSGNSPSTTSILLSLYMPAYLVGRWKLDGHTTPHPKLFYIPSFTKDRTVSLKNPLVEVLKIIHHTFETYKDFKASGIEAEWLLPDFHVVNIECTKTEEQWEDFIKKLSQERTEESLYYSAAIKTAIA
jgi:hypothetical protein